MIVCLSDVFRERRPCSFCVKTFSVPHPGKGRDRIQDLLRLHDEIKTYKVNACFCSYLLISTFNIDLIQGQIDGQLFLRGLICPRNSKPSANLFASRVHIHHYSPSTVCLLCAGMVMSKLTHFSLKDCCLALAF